MQIIKLKKYKFYQRVVALNKMLYVGEVMVPENMPLWRFAVPMQMRVASLGNAATTPTMPVCNTLDYYRVRVLDEVIYVANMVSKYEQH